MFSLFKKTHQQRYNMHLNLKRTKIQQFEHKIKQKSNFVDNSQVTIYTKRSVLKRFTTTLEYQNWNSRLRSTKSRPRYFSRTMGLPASSSDVPSKSTRPSNSRYARSVMLSVS